MARCEDFPCCGCGPEGCIDFDRTVKCNGCSIQYHPDQNTEGYCYRCQAAMQSDEYDGDINYED